MSLTVMARAGVSAVAIAASLGLAGCGASAAGGLARAVSGPVQVVAAENFWGSVAAQVGGRRVHVVSILANPNVDPHLYESDARDAAEVASAALVVDNGVGYDDFMSKLLSTGASKARLVVSAQKVLGVHSADANPHLWYDVPRVPQVAHAIESALARIDPAASGAFQANLARFDASLQPIEAVIARIKAQYPGAPVAYTERVAGYLLADAGLANKTPAGFARAVEDGNDPSPAQSEAMDTILRRHQVRLLIYNVQTVSAVTQHVRQVAATAGVPVVGVSETVLPQYPTYQAWQLAQVRAILRALGG